MRSGSSRADFVQILLTLRENMHKLEQAQGEVRDCITQIAETRSRGGSATSLEQKLRTCRPQAENLLAIVGRQQTIKTLWAQPTPAYRRKSAEVKGLEGRMLVALALG